MNCCFDLQKYLGTWYELAHYPSWFQRNDNYNTIARYTLLDDRTIQAIKGTPRKIYEEPLVQVHNSTISQGKRIDSYGVATYLGETNFRVDFSKSEVDKLIGSREFNNPPPGGNLPSIDIPPRGDMTQCEVRKASNYVIDKIWTNCHGDYIFAVVTDPDRDSLYVLSRYPNPSLVAYSQIMEYVVTHYDRDRLVQTPHYG